ncbi:Glucose 1-dehydrogenase [Geodia barretti]|uniref:Glucose 1-dehydrogenase n=1 Tax=Geodia barretti TaxID=519541 RepID=A0AA35WTD1_GEOBA|nr:Glucose 1-dehydrogenase [Geodia barretti]
MKRFEGKTALVTGASLGIGRGIALCLAEEGANVVVNYRSHQAEAESAAEEIRQLGGEALVWQADVSDRDAIAAMFKGAVDRFGRIDVAVANAAISFGVFHTCQLAAQQMLKQPRMGRSRGKIVVISSIHEEIAFPSSGAYNMSKAAINHLARTMAAELAGQRINVNVINPGWIDTPGERKHFSEEDIAEGSRRLPWGRMGVPEDIGKAAAYLASDDADYVTGTILRVDGGFVHGLVLPEAAAETA